MPAGSYRAAVRGLRNTNGGRGRCGFLLGDVARKRVMGGLVAGRVGQRLHLRRRRRLGSGSRPSPARGIRRSGRAPASIPCRDISGRRSSSSQMSRSFLSRTLSKRETRQRLGRVAGQHLARRRDVDDAAAPAAHAGLGALGVVVRHDEIDDEDALEALARLGDDLGAVEHLLARRHQGLAGSSAPSRSTARAPPRAAARRGFRPDR